MVVVGLEQRGDVSEPSQLAGEPRQGGGVDMIVIIHQAAAHRQERPRASSRDSPEQLAKLAAIFTRSAFSADRSRTAMNAWS